MYYTFAVDRGPERYISNLDVEPGTLYPYWGDLASANGADDMQELMASESNTTINTQQAFDIMGPFHAINLIKLRVLRRIPGWKTHGPGIEATSAWFHPGYNRDYYKVTCLTGNRLHWREMFDSGPPKLEGGRVWGVTQQSVEWHLDRKALLRASCTAARLLPAPAPGGVGQHGGEGAGPVPDADVDAAGPESREERAVRLKLTVSSIASASWWAFVGAL